jgi:hypothetical protein
MNDADLADMGRSSNSAAHKITPQLWAQTLLKA